MLPLSQDLMLSSSGSSVESVEQPCGKDRPAFEVRQIIK